MGYCQQSDIENAYGVDNVRQWSQIANDSGNVDTARIALAIVNGDRIIENTLRTGKYTIPLTATDPGGLPEITDLSARLAGWWLFNSRPHKADGDDPWPDQVRAEAMQMLRGIVSGRILIPAALKWAPMPSAPMQV